MRRLPLKVFITMRQARRQKKSIRKLILLHRRDRLSLIAEIYGVEMTQCARISASVSVKCLINP